MRNQTKNKLNSPSEKKSFEKVESASKNTKLTDQNKNNLEDAITSPDSEEETSNVTAGFIDLATYDALEKYLIKSTDKTK